MTKFYTGTSGWSYLQWEKEFYPVAIKASDKLRHYASVFNSVELNNSFYHTPSAQQFVEWEAQVPKGFRFSVKAPRFITHTKRLRDPETILPRFLEAVAKTKKAGPIFFQLPPNFSLDDERLEAFAKELPTSHRYVMELRDPSWHNDRTYALLEKHKICFCLYDTPEGVSPRQLTTDFAYVRLRGREGRSLRRFLSEWKEWLEGHTRKAYVYFDNCQHKDLAFGNALQLNKIFEEK